MFKLTNFLRAFAPAGAALALFITGRVHADTIAYAGFEDSDSWSGEVIFGSAGLVSSNQGINDSPPFQRILEGTHSFQISGGTASATFQPVDISGFDGVKLTLYVSSTSGTANNGNDTSDFVRLYVALDGADFALTPDIALAGNANARWGFNAALVATTTAGTPISRAAPQGNASTNNYGTFVVMIPDSASSVNIRISAGNDNTGEFWNIDKVMLEGTAIPEPAAWAHLAVGFGLLGGFWRLRGGGSRVREQR